MLFYADILLRHLRGRGLILNQNLELKVMIQVGKANGRGGDGWLKGEADGNVITIGISLTKNGNFRFAQVDFGLDSFKAPIDKVKGDENIFAANKGISTGTFLNPIDIGNALI